MRKIFCVFLVSFLLCALGGCKQTKNTPSSNHTDASVTESEVDAFLKGKNPSLMEQLPYE
ncbi:MAG: hypothetical protein PUB07_02725 [Clostridia bacterium]|nr:hypothetical protein [Clostridia bacterium]